MKGKYKTTDEYILKQYQTGENLYKRQQMKKENTGVDYKELIIYLADTLGKRKYIKIKKDTGFFLAREQ